MRNPIQQNKEPYSTQIRATTITTKREDGSYRIQKCFLDSYSRTKPEFQRETTLKNIVASGQFQPAQNPLDYADLTNEPNLRDVFRTVHEVKSNFEKLPSDIRKLMDNDPSNLKDFLTNPDNKELLVSKGVFSAPESTPEQQVPDNPSSEPATAT